jgi:hypothetical protein
MFFAVAVLLALPVRAAEPSDDQSDTCRDTWPDDRERPTLKETFPKRGISGHVVELRVEVEHLPREVVFPAGLSFSADAPEVTTLRAAHFRLPAAESEVQPQVKSGASADSKSRADGQKVTSVVTLPLIALPPEAGRQELTLPRLPISVARASGQVHTVCTDPHVVVVEDPLASVANPEPRPDPSPRPQLEVWTTLRDVILTLAWAIPLAILLAWLWVKYGSRLKKTPPPPPPVPPWQTAKEQLAALRERKLLEAGLYEEQLDGICDILRQYLGARYGFEGLECTTAELLRAMAKRAPNFSETQAVRSVLQRTDLVKFARKAPSEQECEEAMGVTVQVIERTRAVSVAQPSETMSPPQHPGAGERSQDG